MIFSFFYLNSYFLVLFVFTGPVLCWTDTCWNHWHDELIVLNRLVMKRIV